MDNNIHTPGMGGPTLLLITLWSNIMFYINKSDVTFCLSTAVSLMALYYYFLQTRKLKKEAKKTLTHGNHHSTQKHQQAGTPVVSDNK